MADIFVSRMRKLCNSMSEAIYLAAENEKQAREVCTNANELTTDVEIVSFPAKIPQNSIKDRHVSPYWALEKILRSIKSFISVLIAHFMGFKIAKTTHHMEDELTQTQQQISAIEHELLSVSSRQMKTEKIANELNSRFLHVQSDVQNQRIELEKREDKLKKMKEFLEQNRQQHKVDNKQLYQVKS